MSRIEHRPDRYFPNWDPDRYADIKARMEERERERQRQELRRMRTDPDDLPQAPPEMTADSTAAEASGGD